MAAWEVYRAEHLEQEEYSIFDAAPDSVLLARANLFREDEQSRFESAFIEAYVAAENRDKTDLQKPAIDEVLRLSRVRATAAPSTGQDRQEKLSASKTDWY